MKYNNIFFFRVNKYSQFEYTNIIEVNMFDLLLVHIEQFLIVFKEFLFCLTNEFSTINSYHKHNIVLLCCKCPNAAIITYHRLHLTSEKN